MASWATLISLQPGQQNHELTADKTTIGRKSTNIEIKNLKLSATHCVVFKEAGVPYIEDNSSNGTYVNDTKMSKGAKLPLKDGDKIWLLHPSKVAETLGFEFKLTSSPIAEEPSSKKN
jgi:E3 ubiquitin-protein ligase CHFR